MIAIEIVYFSPYVTASKKTYMQGTVHAMAKEERAEMDDKAKKGWWPCQSYKCTKGGQHHMNPKYADKCGRCGAMKPFNASGAVFHHNMSDEQFMKNQSKYKGK